MPRRGRFAPRTPTRYPLHRRLGGPEGLVAENWAVNRVIVPRESGRYHLCLRS
jgi:hypothetical protein